MIKFLTFTMLVFLSIVTFKPAYAVEEFPASYKWGPVGTTYYPTGPEACTAFCNLYPKTVASCTQNANFSYSAACTGGGGSTFQRVSYCPTGSTLVGTMCQCPSGKIVGSDGNSCIDPPTCPPAGTVKTSGYYPLGTNPEAAIPNIGCDGNCETTYSGSGVTKRAMINGIYNYYYGTGSYNYTGATCNTGTTTPNPTSIPPNTCDPATQTTGQVNGVTVCVPKNDTNNTNTTTSPPVTDPTTGNTTTTTNVTNNNTTNNTTTTTTTTTTTAPDGTVTQTENQTTTKSPPSTFCQQNPTDPTCLKNSKFCEDNPETLGCSTMGTVEDGIVGSQQRSIADITPKTIGGAGSCPAPITTSFMGRTITFTYDLPCQAAGMLKPLILALAWLGAGIIFIGGVKQ